MSENIATQAQRSAPRPPQQLLSSRRRRRGQQLSHRLPSRPPLRSKPMAAPLRWSLGLQSRGRGIRRCAPLSLNSCMRHHHVCPSAQVCAVDLCQQVYYWHEEVIMKLSTPGLFFNLRSREAG